MIARIAKNGSAQILTLVVAFADRILVVGVLLRAWGTDVYSDWTLLVSSAGLLSLGDAGLHVYFSNAYHKIWITRNAARFQRTVSVALGCSFAAAATLGGGALVFLLAADLPNTLSISTMAPFDAVAVAALMGAAALSRVARGVAVQIFRGRDEFALGVMIDLIPSASAVAVATTGGLIGAAPVVIACGYLASDVIGGWGATIWNIRKRYPELRIKPAFPSRAERTDLFANLTWLAAQVGGPIAWMQIPVLLLGHAGAPSEKLVGFVIVRTLVNFIRSAGVMISVAAGVEFVGLHHAGRDDAAARGLEFFGKGLSVISGAVAAGLLVFGHFLVSLWTGRPDLYDDSVAWSLVVSAALGAPAVPISYFLTLMNVARPQSIGILAQMAVGFPICAAIAPSVGVAGVALGLAGAELIGQSVVAPVLAAKRLPRVGDASYYARCLLLMAISATWSAFVGLSTLAIFDTGRWLGLFAACGAWALLGLFPPFLLALPAGRRATVAVRVRSFW
jgi:O-antigen/teichoic acid export membrane protein